MDKFLNDEIEFLETTSENSNSAKSLAGGSYMDHTKEIEQMIDKGNRINAEAYRKAYFSPIGTQ